jgi:hypothetical protein
MNKARLNCIPYEIHVLNAVVHRRVRWTSKSDLSSTTKCDQNYISRTYKLVTPKAWAKHEPLIQWTGHMSQSGKFEF